MKRLITLLLVAGALVVTAIGCGDTGSGSKKGSGGSGGSTPAESKKM